MVGWSTRPRTKILRTFTQRNYRRTACMYAWVRAGVALPAPSCCLNSVYVSSSSLSLSDSLSRRLARCLPPPLHPSLSPPLPRSFSLSFAPWLCISLSFSLSPSPADFFCQPTRVATTPTNPSCTSDKRVAAMDCFRLRGNQNRKKTKEKCRRITSRLFFVMSPFHDNTGAVGIIGPKRNNNNKTEAGTNHSQR